MRLWLGLVLTLILTGNAAARDRNPSEITLSGEHRFTAYIVNEEAEDVPVTLLVNATESGHIKLNYSFVQAAGIDPGYDAGYFTVGPIRFPSFYQKLRLRADTLNWKGKAYWSEGEYVDDEDGAIGPYGLPHDIVRFQWREEQPGEEICTMRLHRIGWTRTAGTRIKVGKRTINVFFSSLNLESIATAAAGAALAEAFDGELVGKTESATYPGDIDRPIRKVVLSEPLRLCAITLNDFHVRLQDYGDSSGIVDGDLRRANKDSDELTIIGAIPNPGTVLYDLDIRQEDMQHCSSVTFDKRKKQIRLSCLPQAKTQ